MQATTTLASTSPSVEVLRKPPQSIEAEQAVLGGAMLENSRLDALSEVLRPEDFFLYAHRLIFSSMMLLLEAQQPIDIITVHDFLSQRNELEKVGGFSYLADLVRATPSSVNLLHYAAIVRDRSMLRRLLEEITFISESVYHTEGNSAQEIVSAAEHRLFSLSEQQTNGPGPQPLSSILKEAVQKIEERSKSGNPGMTGIPSGFLDLDRKTSGLQASDLIILAARPAMGKTTLAMNICMHAAFTSEKPVLVFSLEMSSEQIIFRLLSALSQVKQSELKSGQLKDDDWHRIMSSMGLLLEKKNLYLDDASTLSPIEVRARAKKLYREYGGLSLIMIDYLQLMHSGKKTENRNLEIGEISRSLKAIAKELHVPVLVLSQLNRSLEQRSEKRPLNSDLRESGSIEQDADLILFIYRDEVYHPIKATPDGPSPTSSRGEAELIIGKQRNGPIGTIKLTFRGEYSRFDNYSPAVIIGGEVS